MSSASLAWGAPEWAAVAIGCGVAAAVLLLACYLATPGRSWVKWLAAALKAIGVSALVVCLVEPLLSGERPRPGANVFVLAVDNSESLTIKDEAEKTSRGEQLAALLDVESPWRTRLSQQFDVRTYLFDAHLRGVDEFSELFFDGAQSSLFQTADSLRRRFKGLPLAGVLLFTDAIATDAPSLDAWRDLPPVYPVVMGANRSPPDVSVAEASVTQTNFESAPVTVRADVASSGRSGSTIVARLLDAAGTEIDRQFAVAAQDESPVSFRFQFRPDRAGVSFYTVRAAAIEGDSLQDATDAKPLNEATHANNDRVVAVDRGGGPYRILYVCGRPNWEFKFLRRALAGDEQLDLVGLIRIAKRQAKFVFQQRDSVRENPLYDGFEESELETAERREEAVLLRLGVRDGEEELLGGFPDEAEELFAYDAIILDDVEADFFTQDQLRLIEGFVSRRGGGFLMLGGVDSFTDGKYDRTPVGAVLPVYLDGEAPPPTGDAFRLSLTREGWLEPWVRTRKTEEEERMRLHAMSPFAVLSTVGRLKPGATVLSQVEDVAGEKYPALVAQRFGEGRSAALLVGDLWRWSLRRDIADGDDFERAWRQTIRWLVAEVPQRVDASIRPAADSESGAVEALIRVRDEKYLPLDNARVKVRLALPDGREVLLDAEQTEAAGAYAARFVPRDSGAYLASVSAIGPGGEELGVCEAGWVAQGAADEFRTLSPDRELAGEIAAATGGEVVDAADLERFVSSLSSRAAPITERWFYPLWHTWTLFGVAVACLAGEWGLRRIKGLA